MAYNSPGEYTSPHSFEAAPNAYADTTFQCDNTTNKVLSSSRQDRNYGKQTFAIRKEAAYAQRRQPTTNEPKLEGQRPNDAYGRSAESSFHTAPHGRNPIKADRPIKGVNRKFKQIPSTECLPEPPFEISLSDFPKLQHADGNDLLDLQKHAWGPVGSAEGDQLPLKPRERLEKSALITKEGEVSVRKDLSRRSLNFDPGVPLVSSGLLTEPQVSWATVLSQTPKKVIPGILANSPPSSKDAPEDDAPEDHKSETRKNASANELEELSEKKKRKKKKKPKSNSDVETLPNNSFIVQEPPRIKDEDEFPDLAAAADKKYKSVAQKFDGVPPITKDESKVTVTMESGFESHDGCPQNELVTPKSDVPSGRKANRQISLTAVEKRKTKESSKNSGKKSQAPVQLDLGGMLAALEQKQNAEKSKSSSKPLVLSVGGAVTLPSKESITVTKSHQLNQGKTPHNPLDSSAPLVKKGKQREVPKAKKPSPLKKIILKEREQRKQQHLLEQSIPKDGDSVQPCAESGRVDQTSSEDTRAGSAEDALVVPVAQVHSSSEVLLECAELSGAIESTVVPTHPSSNIPKIHSRRFRDYCTQVLSKEVDSCVTDLLKELVRFQDRLYQKDPVKAKTKRRLVMGLREVLKHLKLKKLKCVIISPNCEKIQSKGGLDETLHLIIDAACEQNIPFVFALNRKALGRCVNKVVPVSVVGIFSYDGAQDYFHKMVELTVEARLAYKEMIAALERESAEEEGKNDCARLKTHCSGRPQDSGQVPLPESDEDAPNYIKIWKQKLEEEYNPYALELEKQATAETLTLGVEEPK
ncbi:selenocysteine insertion sequence-binding protein 2 isoform X2 [Tiliqua scincoides]